MSFILGISLVGCSTDDQAALGEGGAGDAATGSAASSGDGGAGQTAGTAESASATATSSTAASGGEPITGLATETWTWVPFADAHCADGSSTGIGMNVNPGSTKVMVFMDGGGACFNATTCAVGNYSYGSSDFDSFASGAGTAGVFDRTDALNAVRDWSFVYLPYCTGDIMGGQKPNGTVPGVSSPQQFVGWSNVTQYLSRVVPSFPSATQVLLTGSSAGGFAAEINYGHVQKAFGSVPVDMLSDAGPFMSTPDLAACLENSWRTLWNLDATVIADCGTDCSDGSNYMIDYAKHITKTYPSRKFGLLDSTADTVIADYFGNGANNCQPPPQKLTPQQYKTGLLNIRSALGAAPNFGSFYFTGTQHTSLIVALDSRTAGGVPLTTWLGSLVGGSISNVGP